MVDAIVIGGGFFGLYVAEHLARHGQGVLLCERGPVLMGRASYNNQARVHNGYHYPRSLLTARARTPTTRGCRPITGIASTSRSRSTTPSAAGPFQGHGQQFFTYFEQIGSPIDSGPRPGPPALQPQFDRGCFRGPRSCLRCGSAGPADGPGAGRGGRRGPLALGSSTAGRPQRGGNPPGLHDAAEGPQELDAGQVFNCTYAHMNRLLAGSGLPLIPLKQELTEMALVRVPEPLAHMGITLMCGPFFSVMPFPRPRTALVEPRPLHPARRLGGGKRRVSFGIRRNGRTHTAIEL